MVDNVLVRTRHRWSEFKDSLSCLISRYFPLGTKCTLYSSYLRRVMQCGIETCSVKKDDLINSEINNAKMNRFTRLYLK